ncbi:MAG: SIS domain-containing protein [Hyphomonadaceae bacterium]|nr:SIS domain-containing protein [Hyphomonadaceae bacterium]
MDVDAPIRDNADSMPTIMETEAREAPAVAERLVRAASAPLRALGARLCAAPPRFAVTAGRGSSGAAALLAKYLIEARLGLPVASAAPSLQSVYGRSLALDDALLLVVSQSGRSPDLIEVCRSAHGHNLLRVGFINAPDAPLAQHVDVCIPLQAGPERSVAATKSCLAAMTMVLGLVAHWSEDAGMIAAFERTPDILADALARDWPSDFLGGDGPVYVVGRGPGLAFAKEAALKLKETNGLFAEALSAAEIRHGPLALVGPALRIIVFAQRDAAFESQCALAAELEGQGARVLLVASGNGAFRVKPDPEPVLELMSMLLGFYLMASDAAVRRGRSPDAPPMLSKVTETR